MSLPSISVIIATRNRPEALRLSLPLYLHQSLAPHELVIVDASEHSQQDKVKQVVDELAAQATFPVQFLTSEPSAAAQRNLGAKECSGDVLFFPDDDSLLYPDTMEKLAQVYALDANGALAGVSCRNARISPLDERAENEIKASPSFSPDQASRLRRFSHHIDSRYLKTPLVVLGNAILQNSRLPDVIASHRCRLVSWQYGFLMSFRAGAFRRVPFNQNLKKYSWGEDRDICFGMREEGAFALAPDAWIYHHRFPGRRGEGYWFGKTLILNHIYILCRHTEQGHPARKQAWRFLTFELGKSLVRLFADADERRRGLGTMSAMRGALQLLRARRDQLDMLYLKLTD
jgi:glycosyltransferase involved in cell wall biosynthesis